MKNIDLSTLKDGSVLLVNDGSVPDLLKRIEFYQDQKVILLVYVDQERDSDLMEFEIPDTMIETMSHSPDVMIYTTFENHDPVGYKVPLIQVGDLY